MAMQVYPRRGTLNPVSKPSPNCMRYPRLGQDGRRPPSLRAATPWTAVMLFQGWSPTEWARGGHGHPKVSLGPTMPYPSKPCGQATPETALRPFQGWPRCRASGLRLSSIHLDTPRHMSMSKVKGQRPKAKEVESKNKGLSACTLE
jgi:hypothetical protein